MHSTFLKRRAKLSIMLLLMFASAAACEPANSPVPLGPAPRRKTPLMPPFSPDERVDRSEARKADYSLFFIGNSHTAGHDLPNLIRKMIEHRQPGKKVVVHTLFVGFLDEAYKIPTCVADIESGDWKHVILQAQKISMSGKYDYSREEGIELAKRAKKSGAAAIFYGEWGLKGKPGDGDRLTKIYREMADKSGASVAPVARAWDLALVKDAALPLHSGDGNHQSATGAFLTACVLYGQITGESPRELAKFPYAHADEKTRIVLAQLADQALREQKELSEKKSKAPAAKLP